MSSFSSPQLASAPASAGDTYPTAALLCETMPHGIVFYDASGTVINANPAALRLLGLPLPQLMSRGLCDPAWQALHEDGTAFTMTSHPVSVALATGKPALGTIMGVFNPSNREHVWLHVDAVPLAGENTAHRCQAYATMTDISHWKRATDTARQAEKCYRLVFDTSPDAITLSRLKDGTFIDVNEGFTRISGYELEQIIGRSSQEINIWQNPDDRQKLTRTLMSQQSVVTMEAPFRLRDGSRHTGLISTRLVTIDGEQYIICVCRDISRQKEAIEALRESENLLSSILRTAPIGIGVAINRMFTLVNDGICRITGYSRSELLGRNSRLLYFAEEEHLRVGKTKLEQIGSLGIGIVETKWRRKDGTAIDILTSSSPIDTHNIQAGTVFTAVDISKLKKSEKEKEKLQAQIMHAQKLESVGRLAGGVAHDFNNNLAAILGHADLAIKQCDGDSAVFEHLSGIYETAQRSAELVRQLLAFGRRQTVIPQVTDLNESISRLLRMLIRVIGEDTDLTWKPSKRLWHVSIDPTQLDQILTNLCINARDAIDGVGKIIIETGNTTLDKHYCTAHPGLSPGSYARLSISDTGHGIAPDVMEHIFEPFFTTKPMGRGTGLGLSTVYGIVKQNNGLINVYSESGRGTTFNIYLPRTDSAQSSSAQADTVPRTGNGETLLIVEDDRMILKVTTEMTQMLGYRSFSAESPSAALEIARTHASEINAVITDVIMPQMNGQDLARELNEIIPGLPCLFTSGYTANVISQTNVLSEDIFFLQKPFTAKELSEKIYLLLQRAENRNDSGDETDA